MLSRQLDSRIWTLIISIRHKLEEYEYVGGNQGNRCGEDCLGRIYIVRREVGLDLYFNKLLTFKRYGSWGGGK